MIKHNLKRKVFNWNQDEDGDITLSVCNIVHFTKYKEMTLIRWGKKSYEQAPKRINCKEFN